MPTPLVSIILPVYRTEEYLPACLRSVLAQEIPEGELEVVAVDDGSPDRSGEILREAAARDRRVKPYRKENGGLGDARNFGLSRAAGEYVFFLDSDDLLLPGALSSLLAAAREEEADLVAASYRVIDEEGNVKGTRSSLKDAPGLPLATKILLGDNAVWNKLYRRALLEEHHLRFRPRVWYEDVDFKAGVVFAARKFAYCEEPVVAYRVRAGSIMNSGSAGVSRCPEITLAFDQIERYREKMKAGGEEAPFAREVEFLAVEHILIAPAKRICCAILPREEKKRLLSSLREYVEQHYPRYRENPYLPLLTRGEALVYRLLRARLSCLIGPLFRLKGDVS